MPGLLPWLKVKLLLYDTWHKSLLNGNVVTVSATIVPGKAPPGLHQVAGSHMQEAKKMTVRKMCK